MIPEAFKKLLSSTTSDNNMASPSFDLGRVSTYNLQIKGSVHASGEAYLTIKNLHGHLSKADEYDDFNVEGSVHDMSSEDITVENNSVLDVSDLDIKQSANGAENGPERKSIKGKEKVTIETVVLFTEQSYFGPETLDPTFIHFDELQIKGNVHDKGVVEVEIEHLYVF